MTRSLRDSGHSVNQLSNKESHASSHRSSRRHRTIPTPTDEEQSQYRTIPTRSDSTDRLLPPHYPSVVGSIPTGPTRKSRVTPNRMHGQRIFNCSLELPRLTDKYRLVIVPRRPTLVNTPDINIGTEGWYPHKLRTSRKADVPNSDISVTSGLSFASRRRANPMNGACSPCHVMNCRGRLDRYLVIK